MKLPWGRPKQPDREYFIVLDIGATVAKALIVYVEDNEIVVAGRAYVRQKAGSMNGGMIVNLTDVAATCGEAIDKAMYNIPYDVTNVVMGVNGQLIESVTTTIHYDRVHPDHPLEHAELKNIIYKIQQRSEDKLRSAIQTKFYNHHPDIQLIHSSVVDVQLDGYAILDPLGFQGKRLSLTVFNAYIPLVYTSILQNLAKALDLNLISIAAIPYGLSKLLAAPGADNNYSGIFIDIGGRTTDVAIVREGRVETIKSFAMGGSAFTKAIKDGSKGTLDKAERNKLEYVNTNGNNEKIQEILTPQVQLWLKALSLTLGECANSHIFPNRIYLTGGSAPLPDLKKGLLTKEWQTNLPFSQKAHPVLLDGDAVIAVADEQTLDWKSQDLPPLGIAKLALNLTDQEDVVSQTLQSIARGMQNN